MNTLELPNQTPTMIEPAEPPAPAAPRRKPTGVPADGKRRGAKRGTSKTPGFYIVPPKLPGQAHRLIVPDLYGSERAKWQGAIPPEHDSSKPKREAWKLRAFNACRAVVGVQPGQSLLKQTLVQTACTDLIELRARDQTDTTVKNSTRNLRTFWKWAAVQAATDPAYTYIESFTQPMLAEYRDYLLRRRRKDDHSRTLLLSTANNYLATVRALFAKWCADGKLPFLTREKVQDALREVPVGAKRKRRRKDPRAWTQEEIRIVLTAALIVDGLATRVHFSVQVAPFIMFCLLGGFRRDEQMNVRGTDISNMIDEITVRVGKTLDTEETHGVAIKGYSVLLRELLQVIRNQCPDPTETLFPFHYKSFERPMRLMRTVDLRLAQKHGLPPLPANAQFPGGTSIKTARATCSTFQDSLTHIGTRTKAARQQHGVQVESSHYFSRKVKIPLSAPTLEQAMGCEDLMRIIIQRYQWRPRRIRRSR